MKQLKKITVGNRITLSTPFSLANQATKQALVPLLQARNTERTAEEASAILKTLDQKTILQPLQTEEQKSFPIDQNRFILLYEDINHPNDPDYMVGIIFQRAIVNGKESVDLAGAIVGDKFEGGWEYKRSCCSSSGANAKETGLSMALCIKNKGKTIVWVLDTEVTNEGCKQLFKKDGRSIIVSSHEIKHMLGHAQHGANHECGHDHRKLPTARPA